LLLNCNAANVIWYEPKNKKDHYPSADTRGAVYYHRGPISAAAGPDLYGAAPVQKLLYGEAVYFFIRLYPVYPLLEGNQEEPLMQVSICHTKPLYVRHTPIFKEVCNAVRKNDGAFHFAFHALFKNRLHFKQALLYRTACCLQFVYLC
jgi:hypothetical protein